LEAHWKLSAAHRLRNMDLDQCFSTFFGSRHPVRLKKIWQHPYLDKTTIWGTLTPLVVKELKKEVNSIFGGTRDTSSRHPCVPRHPGWKPLIQTIIQTCIWIHTSVMINYQHYILDLNAPFYTHRFFLFFPEKNEVRCRRS